MQGGGVGCVFDGLRQPVVGGFGGGCAVFGGIVETFDLFAGQIGGAAAFRQLFAEGGKLGFALQFAHHLLEAVAYQAGIVDTLLARGLGGRLKVGKGLFRLGTDALADGIGVDADFFKGGAYFLRRRFGLAADFGHLARRIGGGNACVGQRLADFRHFLGGQARRHGGLLPFAFGFQGGFGGGRGGFLRRVGCFLRRFLLRFADGLCGCFLRAFRLLRRFDGCVGGGLIGGAGFGLQTRETLLLRLHRVLGRAHGGRLERQGAFFRFAEVFFRRSLHIRCRPLEVGCHFAEADFGQTFQHQGGGRLCSTGKGLDGNTDGGEAVLNGAQQDVDAVQPRFEYVEILPAAAEQGVEGVACLVDVADNGFNQVRHFRRTGFGGIVGGNKGIR